ncbi:sensor histidine kinase [Paenibacillus caseinilyticus]|nr:HAMP domain-containing sensor histidine kinase [Paenibacillus caseinilyticus]MCZ8523256.1 HAMP domain-containing sensor histidine kinase [Paenibacillus caseinilyticus]
MKLILSNIAMVVVPLVLFVLTAALFASLFLHDVFGLKSLILPDGGGGKAVEERFERKNEWYTVLEYFAREEPERFRDTAFLKEAEAKLAELQSGIVVLREGKVAFSSSWIGPVEDPAVLTALPQKKEGDNAHEQEVVLNGTAYYAFKQEIQWEGGGSGEVVLLEDQRLFSMMARRVFPLLLGTVLLVHAVTNGGLTYLVSRSIIRPLRELKRAAERIKDGQLEQELRIARRDEIGEVGAAFEEMRQRLLASIRTQLQYEENRKELLTSISHDLKTPLTAIQSCAEGLRDGIADTPEKRERYVGMIHSKALHLNRLIDELFLFSKLDLKRLPFHFERLDLRGYVTEYAEELRHDPRMREMELRCDIPPGGPPLWVSADREKLGRVLMNIVDNSLKHRKGKADGLSISLRVAGGEAELTLEDNGPGIEVQALPWVFDRFYRGDPARAADSGGSGLGLAIVKGIVEEHGGRVRARSGPGQGTAIIVTLPLVQGEGGGERET